MALKIVVFPLLGLPARATVSVPTGRGWSRLDSQQDIWKLRIAGIDERQSARSAISIRQRLLVRHDAHVPGLLFAEAQVISTEAEFNRVAERRPANNLDKGAVAETHLKEAAAEVGIAADGDDASVTADPELVQATGLGRSAVVTTCKTTRLLH